MPIPLIAPQLVEGVSQMLWDFGFRHHPELQTKWIDGVAGIGVCAEMTDKSPVVPDFEQSSEEFLAVNNPEVLEAIKRASPEDKEVLRQRLNKNLGELQVLLNALGDNS